MKLVVSLFFDNQSAILDLRGTKITQSQWILAKTKREKHDSENLLGCVCMNRLFGLLEVMKPLWWGLLLRVERAMGESVWTD